MYLPEYFEQPRIEELHRLIVDYPLGILIINGRDGLDANHLPFELEPGAGEHGRLLAHVARANPLWQEVADGQETLVVFRSGHGYISPNWYPSKHELHRQVPTWNYQVVHVHGRMHVRDDERFVRGVVARLTRANEGRTGSARPWKMSDSSPEYIEQMLSAIVGIEIDITRIVGKWKLSQNKDARDRATAAEELRKRGELVISQAMLATIEPEDGSV